MTRFDLGLVTRAICALLLIAAMSWPGNARADEGPASIQNPPDIDMLDERSVQIDSGYLTFGVPDVSIGGAPGLAHVTRNDPAAGSHGSEADLADRYRFSGFYPEVPHVSSFVGGIHYPPVFMGPRGATFSFQGVSERFTGDITQGEAPGASLSGDGGSLTNNGNGTWTYLDKQGVSYLVDTNYQIPNFETYWPVTKVTYPDGSTVRIYFKRSAGTSGYSRIQGVEKSNGFFLKFFYASNAEPTTATRQAWSQYNRVVAGNKASEYCDLSADSCTFAQAWPESQAYFSNNNTRFSIIDSQGRETRFTLNQYFEAVAVKPATSDGDTITYEMCARHHPGNCTALNSSGASAGELPSVAILTFPGMVFAATLNGDRTTYGYQPAAGGYYNVLSSSDPYRGPTQVLTLYGYSSDPATGSLRQVDLPQLRAYYNFGALNRLTQVLRTGSTHEDFTWDSRRNMTSRSLYPKDGDASPALTTTIDFEPVCSNIVICNKPRFVLDPKGNRTDYGYSAVHGLLTAVTAPMVNNVRPQTRYEYVQRTAWVKNSSGGYTASAPIWVLAKESFCRTSGATGNSASPCLTAGDEVATAYDYGPNSGPNNLLVRGKAVTADGATLRTCYAYDRFSNKISETTARAGLTSCP